MVWKNFLKKNLLSETGFVRYKSVDKTQRKLKEDIQKI